MRILLLGKYGQVGWELQRALAPLGETVALGRGGADGLCGDLADLDGLAATVRAVAPDVIVNAAAYTAVDKAESEPALAHRINGEAPGVLARETAAIGALLVHYSTDYVFDGSGAVPWREDAQPAPLSSYGRSKLAGEQAVIASGAIALLIRTCWVYAARGQNFARTMLRLAQERDQLRVIADQFGAPTSAELIADVSAHMIRAAMQHKAEAAALSGVYHLAAGGETTWCDYARYVLERAQQHGVTLKVGPAEVEAITTDAYPTLAPRPANSRLDTTRLRTTFGVHLPPWQQGVARMVSELSI